MIRAALYLRVSREDLAIDNQRPELEALCARQGFSVVKVYEEQESAAAARRPVREEMLSDAHKGRFDILVVWALDRLGRSMHGNIQDVLRLDRAGVRIVSAQEPWLDTRGPVRELLVAIFSWVAEQERSRMIERTKAGLERARAAGKKIGRPRRVTPELAAKIDAMVAEDWTMREIAAALKIPKATILRSRAARSETPSQKAAPQVPETT